MSADRPIVFVDTNVLVPTLLRNIMLELAVSRTIELHWSAQVMDELQRTLAKLRNRPPAEFQPLLTAMNTALPAASVARTSNGTIKAVLPDPNDQGILADALTAGCAAIVTFNTRHFPAAELAKDDPHLTAANPDAFLLNLITNRPTRTFAALAEALRAFKAPPLDRPAFLDHLARVGLPQSAQLLAHLDQP